MSSIHTTAFNELRFLTRSLPNMFGEPSSLFRAIRSIRRTINREDGTFSGTRRQSLFKLDRSHRRGLRQLCGRLALSALGKHERFDPSYQNAYFCNSFRRRQFPQDGKVFYNQTSQRLLCLRFSVVSKSRLCRGIGFKISSIIKPGANF